MPTKLTCLSHSDIEAEGVPQFTKAPILPLGTSINKRQQLTLRHRRGVAWASVIAPPAIESSVASVAVSYWGKDDVAFD